MIINRFKIGKRLIFSFSILLSFTIIVGTIAIYEMNKLAEISSNMYRHPLTVSNAVRDIKSNIIAIHRSMKDVALANSPAEISFAKDAVNRYEIRVYELFKVVHERFLGEKEQVIAAEKSFRAWKKIRDEVIQLSLEGKTKAAADITKGKGPGMLSW